MDIEVNRDHLPKMILEFLVKSLLVRPEDLGERGLLAEIEYKIILAMFSLVCKIVYSSTLEWAPFY